MAGPPRLMRWSCVAVTAAALAALAGKLLNVPVLASAIPTSIPMAPYTAGALLFLAAALHPDLPWSRSRRVRLGLLVPVFLLALPALAGFAARSLAGGWAAGAAAHPIDVWKQLWIMSPLTGGLLLALGALAGSFVRRGSGRPAAAQAWAAAFTAAASFIILIGYAYGVPPFYGGRIIPMAATTAACFLVLSCALLAEHGRGLEPWNLFEGDSPRALMMRAFVPLCAGVIFVIGLVDSRMPLEARALPDALVILAALICVTWLVTRVSARVAASIESAERRLRASEDRTRTILRTALDGFWLADREGRLLDVNDAYSRMSGYSREELLSMNFAQFEAQDAPHDAAAHLHSVIKHGEDRFETRHRRKDGTTYPVDICMQYKAVDGGHLIAFLRDTTTRKQAEKEREQFFRFFQTSADMMCLADPNGAFLKTNPAFTETLGYSAEELVSKPFIEFIVPEDKQATVAEMARQQKKGNSFNFENRYRCKDGSVKWLSWRAIYDKTEKITYATARDITQRKRVEEALRDSEARFRTLIESAPEAVFVQAGGRFQYLNPAAVRLFGAAKAEELIGREFLPLIAPEHHDAVRERVRLQKETGRPAPLKELEFVRLDGSRFAVESTAFPIRYHGVEANVVFVRDISARKQLETETIRVQKLESLGVLAGGIAHDFNNMLTSVLGSLALLKDGTPAEGDRQQIAQEAMSACLSAKGLAKQLLTFASGGTPVVEVMDLAALVSEAASFSARGTSVRCGVTATGDCFAKVDKDQLTQVVQNLVLNAIQAMPAGGVVNVDLARAGELILLQVRDTGTGIAKEDLPRIFDPFFSTKGKSRGLGLAMCHSIVTKHGGSINVDSRPGAGTAFTILLPAAAVSERPAKPAAQPVRTGAGRVLIMDDEKSVVTVLGRMLSRLGYGSEAATDGEAALALYDSARKSGKPFDTVVMDLTIVGGMGGKEAAQRLLAQDPLARIIVSSGYSDDPIVADFAKYGFCGALIKPYKLEDVSAALARATETKGSAVS